MNQRTDNANVLNEIVGERLRQERTRQGWTQTQMGEKLKDIIGRAYDPATISEWEKGNRRTTISDLYGLCAVFGVSIYSMLMPTDPDQQINDEPAGVAITMMFKPAEGDREWFAVEGGFPLGNLLFPEVMAKGGGVKHHFVSEPLPDEADLPPGALAEVELKTTPDGRMFITMKEAD